MKQNPNLTNLHIGNIIKKIALNKGISSKKIAETLCRYEQNADKIYGLEDMDVEDVVQISYLLEYNFLKAISDEYLSHLPPVETQSEQGSYHLEFDMQIGYATVHGNIGKRDFLQNINIGQNIKNIAEKKGLNQQDMANQLGCSQTTVSFLYKETSLKVKKIIRISNVLEHNIIAEVYLSKMFIVSSLSMFTSCTTTITP